MIRLPIPFTVGLATILAVASAPAQLPTDQDDRLEDLGEYSPTWFAELQDVELSGNLAYVFGVGGLAIFDISDPTLPIELGRYEPPGHPYNRYYRGAVSGGLACGGARQDLLGILDVSDPANPQILSVHGAPGQSFEGTAMVGNFIFACRHDQGLEIIDVTDPLAPATVSEVTGLVNAWDVVITGQHAFVADGSGGLAVVNVANPNLPVLVTSVPTSGNAVDITISGTTAVVCSGSAGIDIFDVGDPAGPVLVGSVNTSGLAITAAIDGNLVHVADWDDVETFDITNPAVPVPVGGEDTPVRAMGLAAQNGLVAVTDWSRLRLYSSGPTTRGDIQLSVESINFGSIAVGATIDTTFTIGNTGGGPVEVSLVEDFSDNFTVLDPGPFTIPVGGTVEVGLSFFHAAAGYDATFIKVSSDDTDEDEITFPVQADDSPLLLVLGESAPDFTHLDSGGVSHSLFDYRGRVVVLAFLTSW